MKTDLTGAKEGRKRAELDAQLLANRIALLKQEEKAWKKIEETQKRAAEVKKLRADNEHKFHQKEEMYKAKWENIRAAQQRNAHYRDKNKALRDGTRAACLEQRQANVHETKVQSQQLLLQKKDREAQDRQENTDRSRFIKTKKDEAKRRMEVERLAQLERHREAYESRIAQEEMLRQRTEALVATMEKEEMQLITRLQNTQTVQKNAYDELEAALGSTSAPISSVQSKGHPRLAA